MRVYKTWSMSFFYILGHCAFADSPPIRPDGSAHFLYINKSQMPDNEVFLQIFGVNPHSGKQCFIQYDEQGYPSYHDVENQVISQLFSYPLTYFPASSLQEGRSFYLPILDGARIFTSIEQKLSLLVSKNDQGVWTISSPDPLNPSDPNRGFLWDKTEFAVNQSVVFINPTAVDSFCLTLHCQEQGRDGTSQVGGLLESRKMIFDSLKTSFAQAGSYWPQLVSENPSLVYSPMYGADTQLIPQNIFVSSGWIDAFKTLFSNTPLMIDAEESIPVDKGGGVWLGLLTVSLEVN